MGNTGKRKLTASQAVSAKRKRTEEPDDVEVSPPLKTKYMTFGGAKVAGYEYGGYVRDCIRSAKTPLDFATFVNALPRGFEFDSKLPIYMPRIRTTEGRTYNQFDLSNYRTLTLHLEKIALTTPNISSSKSTEIKAALDLFQTSSSDIQRTSPQLSAQLNTIIHNMHECLNNNGRFVMEYIDKTKEHLKSVKDAQDMLQKYGSEEEVKLQKRVVDSVSNRLEKVGKLQAIFRTE